MQTSTSKKDNLRKSALENAAKRAKRTLYNGNEQSFNELPEVNDELDRSIRRSAQNSGSNSSSIVSLPQSPQVATNEIRTHFELCLKMFAENKISSKNAWKLKIIDYMGLILESNNNVLQVASTSLDTSARIYGIRVDDIHSTGLKLASTMARVESQNENRQRIQKDPKPTKSKEKVKKPTVVEDPTTLVYVNNIPKIESGVFRINKNLPTSSTSDLLTNKLPMNYGGYTLMLPNEPRTWPTYAKKDENINFTKTYPVELPSLNKFQTCPPFSNFIINEWNPDEENISVEENHYVDDHVTYDENGFQLPELDGSIHDLFADENDNHSNSEDGHGSLETNVMNFIGDCRPVRENTLNSSYSFMDFIKINDTKFITRIWSGPSHWKLKYIKPRAAVCARPNKKSRARRVEIQPINFFSKDAPILNKNKFYKQKNYRISKIPFKLTIPEFECTNITNNRPLLLRHNNHLNVGLIDENVNQNVEANNCENSDSPNELDEELQFEDDDNQMEVCELRPNNFLEKNFIEAPQLVENLNIKYASQAKKICVKKLKDAVYKSLIDKETNEIEKTSFSHVYREIPKYITKSMRDELSAPLGVVALLHVASENNLLLKQNDNLSDITIEKS